MSETEFNCNKCESKDTDRMVQCDTCDKWYHFECVAVDSSVANVSWSCSNCPAALAASTNVTQTTHHTTADFSAGTQATSSPPPAIQADADRDKGAYKKAHQPCLTNHGPSNITAIRSETIAPSKNNSSVVEQNNDYIKHHFHKASAANLVDNNLSSHEQLQLQMLEEEKELQRQYLERKYKILSQSNSQLSCSLVDNYSSRRPTAAQIAARQVIPKDLPKFDGNPEDWPLFISNYRNSTELAGYSDGENLMRLQSCLRGRAKELVKSKLLIPSMVGEIIQTLEMCFGRPEHILDIMIDKVIKIPPLKDKLDSIIEYALTIRNIHSTMEACNMVAHLNNPMLVKTLVDKLPNNHKLNWAMHPKDGKGPIVKVFSDWIYAIADAASQVVTPTIGKKNASVNTHQQSFPATQMCVVCKSEAHKIQSCGEFQSLNLDAKWNIVKENKLCRQCLNFHRRKCFSNKQCSISGCTAKHHPLLHKYTNTTSERSEIVNAHSGELGSHFRILPIRIYCNGGFVDTFAFLDEGSSVTLIEQTFFNKLKLKGESEPLELRWTGDTTRSEDDSVKVNIEVSNVNADSRFMLYDVHTVSNLGLPTQSLDFNSISKINPYLKGLPVQSYSDAKPMILIGLNNWRVAVPLKIREGGHDQPIATKTRLGWTLQGGAKCHGSTLSLNIHTCECEKRYEALHDEVKEYFALEVPNEKNILSVANEKAMKALEETAVKINHQFEVGLLWKDDQTQLPESYDAACRRSKCLQRKFHKDPKLRLTMQAEIDKLISRGYARKVSSVELSTHNGPVWYLPIFVAINPNKPDKVRLVWDAAAKSHNKCLNDFLISGPDLLTPLFNILIEFRVGQIAVCGDIAEMFHRINVKDEDMHAQRFLWFDTDGSQYKPCVYVMKALTFGISCAPCIAHFVRNRNADEFSNLYPRAVKAVKSHHYMDDLIDSVDTEEEAILLANQVKSIHASGGFHMRNWASNSPLVRAQLCNDGPAAQNSFGATEKILGMYWQSNNDIFQYNFRFSRLKRDVFQTDIAPTKREVLQVLMSIFDPLGFLSPYTIGLKILLQDIWRSGLKWDNELNGELYAKWRSWLANLDKISSTAIPRCYSKLLKMTQSVQLHTFVDAGENAYAAVCYFRIQLNDDVDISIVAAKSKVTPLRPISIPRLELQAALIGSRLAANIQKAVRLRCEENVFWSDSKTVLKWLSMDPKNFKAFVMYRVGEILETTNVTQWNWVPSKLNPADLATKTGATDYNMWSMGPAFLRLGRCDWPICRDLGGLDKEELRNRLLFIAAPKCFTMNVEYFSCWRRLYRALSQFLLYIEKLKSRVRTSKLHEYVQFECIQRSKNVLFKYAQQSEFSEEIWCLKKGKPIDAGSKLKQLNVLLDADGIIRAYGRAHSLSCNQVIILPYSHYVTFLVVQYYHKNFHHRMHEAVICTIKSYFYIPKLRVLYKKVRSKCQYCKNEAAAPNPPQMAALPKARLSSFERPFTYVGIDFFGPLYITVGRRKEKRWGVLFTCMTLRAIHMEVAHSLDTNSCIMCIQNFISRRGAPREIYTDNGTNFRAVEKIIRAENLNLKQVSSNYDYIKWQFNPPAAPHMGGAWERLIRTVKSILYAMCPAFKFNDETLRCALCEVEFIINSRPLTFVALESPNDDPLTPNHLLLGAAAGNKPLVDHDHDLRYRWHQTQKFANHFWRRWVREYGPTLVRRTKWLKKVEPVSVGDIVILVDDSLPRNSWPKGVITETIVAKDGQVRRVKVRTGTGVFERPVTKVAVLDVGIAKDDKLVDT